VEADMKVTDPVCKMIIDEDDAAGTSTCNGLNYYFCSGACKEKFDKNPDSFIGEEAPSVIAEISEKGEIFTCPMHPEVQQEGPGSCPKCGMALEPDTPSIAPSGTEWTCPMHPEIVRYKPDNCPKCGMALEPMAASEEEEKNPELIDMTRRFWVSAVLTVPLVIIVMGGLIICSCHSCCSMGRTAFFCSGLAVDCNP
jgi:Cu+-exporting ATPase